MWLLQAVGLQQRQGARMDGHLPATEMEAPRLDLPEDVAALYAWANLKGARYRDFSAARREARARQRGRAAQGELATQAEARARAERAARQAEFAATKAAQIARFHDAQIRRATSETSPGELARERSARQQALQDVDNLTSVAAQERSEASLRATAEQVAAVAAWREAQEATEAHHSAQRQALRYTGDPYGAGKQALGNAPGLFAEGRAPLEPRRDGLQTGPAASKSRFDGEMNPQRFPQKRSPYTMNPQPDFPSEGKLADQAETTSRRLTLPLAASSSESSPAPATPASAKSYPSSPSRESPAPTRPGTVESGNDRPVSLVFQVANSHGPAANVGSMNPLQEGPFAMTEVSAAEAIAAEPEHGRAVRQLAPAALLPAWIESDAGSRAGGENKAKSPRTLPYTLNRAPYQMRNNAPDREPGEDTLQQSRERVASRWYALRGVFDPTTPDMEPIQARAREASSALLAVFSLAGGVGKTTLTASLGRSLSANGDRVLLAEVSPQGILPFYFGAKELRPGATRTFAPPAGSSDAPITLISSNARDSGRLGEESQDELLEELARARERYEHLIVDVGSAAVSTLLRLAGMSAMILVLVAPDMKTILSLNATERFFADILDDAARPVQPRYLLTQFDASLPLHLDVREVMRQRLGDRLLPFAIRRAQEVSDALAEGMTAIDYAPGAGVASDFESLAAWVRAVRRPGSGRPRGVQGSER